MNRFLPTSQSIDPRPHLVTTARHFYERGWMVGTAGNLSVRLADGSFWITASGCSKGELSVDDCIRVAADGTVLEQVSVELKPSAETAIHQALYALFPAQACYHVHSIAANLVSRFTQQETLLLPSLEMLKGLGVKDENPHCTLPIFTNYAQVSRIANEITEHFQTYSSQVPAFLIRDHGVTVWAPSPKAARNYIELMEYIFCYMVAARQIDLWR